MSMNCCVTVKPQIQILDAFSCHQQFVVTSAQDLTFGSDCFPGVWALCSVHIVSIALSREQARCALVAVSLKKLRRAMDENCL